MVSGASASTGAELLTGRCWRRLSFVYADSGGSDQAATGLPSALAEMMMIMEIPKEMVLNLIREKLGADKADEADKQLPDQVDPEQHSDILSRFGVDPKELLGGGLGGLGSKFGL